MTFFKILWAIDTLGALVVLYFFVIGLADGSVSSSNGGLWFIILAALAAIIFGSIWLKSNNHPSMAIGLLLIVAIPAALYLLWILMMMFGNNKWN